MLILILSRINSTALELALWLKLRKEVALVFHPGTFLVVRVVLEFVLFSKNLTFSGLEDPIDSDDRRNRSPYNSKVVYVYIFY